MSPARMRSASYAKPRFSRQRRLRSTPRAHRLERRAATRRAREQAERERFEAKYPMHGVVFHFLAQVFPEPNRGTPIGYLRRGALFRASEGTPGTDCDRTWHRIPGEGFVCRGAGYVIGSTPQSFEPTPVPPALSEALPYSYVFAKNDDQPQYWRLPTPEEEEATKLAIVEARTLEEDAVSEQNAPDSSVAPNHPDGVEAPTPPGEAPLADTNDADDGEEEESSSLLPSYLRLPMNRGFYVSVDKPIAAEDGREFLRTIRGGFVRTGDMAENEPPSMRGLVLGGAWELPLAIVYRQGAHHYRRHPVRSELIDEGVVDRHHPLRPSGAPIEVAGRTYVQSRDGILVRDTVVRHLRRRSIPQGIPPEARWIHVDLSEQALVAYDGTDPVFATLVSTGKAGFETPTGIFRIESKHVSITMDDLSDRENAYSIEDVPWTMYFDGNYALHGAFWHGTFGRTRSHGCINLAPVDARWLFHWASPSLPPSWHGVFARHHEGTFVFIEE